MRISYVLLSATFGMHQYTADLANRMTHAGHDTHVVTTKQAPRDRYAPDVFIHTPIETNTTGFSLEALQPSAIRRCFDAICRVKPDIIHFTGPHLWNVPLMQVLSNQNIPMVHTIHDLHPHVGAVYGRLLYLWNGQVRRTADHLLVHGQCYYKELLTRGVPSSRLTCSPLTHLFVSYRQEQALRQSPPPIHYEPWALFLGRLRLYKGLESLVEAARQLDSEEQQPIGVTIGGQGQLDKLVPHPLPANVEVRNRLITDKEAVDLFSRCGVVVLPYIEASQSALAAAAYFFHKPVIVTQVGALPEYVVHGETGWVLTPDDPVALAQALKTTLEDRTRLVQMGQAGRAWYEQQRQAEKVTLQKMYVGLARNGICNDVITGVTQAETPMAKSA